MNFVDTLLIHSSNFGHHLQIYFFSGKNGQSITVGRYSYSTEYVN